MQKLTCFAFFSALLFISTCTVNTNDNDTSDALGNGLVDIREFIPSVVLDIKYYGSDNFVGAPVDGYLAAKCLLTRQAAAALVDVQQALIAQGKSLKFFDCYRTQRAVDHFVRWAKDLNDTKTKAVHYPLVDKRNLFRDGYIAEKSGHSRGSTLDVTVIDNVTKQELDMGTRYDYFDTLSHTLDARIIGAPHNNRLMLRTLMEANGFKNLEEEWWHYTLVDEPYPDTFFGFPVQ